MDQFLPTCFRCGGFIDLSPEAFGVCTKCGEKYPKVLGIPDLRKDRVPDSTFDIRVAEKLIAAFPTGSFSDLLEIWMTEFEFSDTIREVSRWYYRTQHERGNTMIEMFSQRAMRFYRRPDNGVALDFGCGVGAAFSYLSDNFKTVIAIDLSLVSLILAKKYIEEKGFQNIQLFRAQGEFLPFQDQSFDFITALNVLDHIFYIDEIAAEIFRVLDNGGLFTGDSRNRYDIFLPEPHTHLRGVGFLPRSFAKKYAKWRTNNDYEDVCLLSFWQLKRAFQRYFGGDFRIIFPDINAYGYSGKSSNQIISRIEKIPLLNTAILALFPSHLVIASRVST